MPIDPRAGIASSGDLPMGEICPDKLRRFMVPARCSIEAEANGVTWVAVNQGIQTAVFRGLDKFEVEAWLKQWGWQSTSGGGTEGGFYTCSFCGATCWSEDGCNCQNSGNDS